MSVDAKNYHESNKLQTSAVTALLSSVKNQILAKLIKHQEKDLKVIDIGTGDGRVLVEIFMKLSGLNFARVLGTDRRQEVVEFAQNIYGGKVVNFQVFDIEYGKEEDFERVLKDGPFDFGTSFWCLHYALDHEKTFSNIRKLLKPGGSFYFIFLGDYGITPIHHKLAEKYPQLKDRIYKDLPLFAKDENYKENFPKILSKIGLEIDFLNYDVYEHEFGSEKIFRDTLSSSIPFVYGLEKDFLETFLDEYMKLVKEYLGDPITLKFIFAHGLITRSI